MSDTTVSSTDSLARRFANTQFENRVRRHGDIAREIVNGADEPDNRVTEIAIAVITGYEEITLDKQFKALKLPERIQKALEDTTSLYEHVIDNNVQEWQMRIGLKRGEQALFRANHIMYERSTTEDEIARVNREITTRLERLAERQKQRAKAAKQTTANRSAKSAPSNTSKRKPATKPKASRKASSKAATAPTS